MQIQIRSQLTWIYTVCKGRVYPGSAGQGLINKLIWIILKHDIIQTLADWHGVLLVTLLVINSLNTTESAISVLVFLDCKRSLQNFFSLLCTAVLTLLLLNTTCPVLANSVDPDQLASEEANWSGSTLFVNKYVNCYQKPDQVLWLAGNQKWAWHLNLFSKARV